MNDLLTKIKQARFIWIIGNGGSASTAEHFANDLVKKYYRAIALSANTSLITMLANDYGYQNIFTRQLGVYATASDLLITISCSGTSNNITNALNYAKLKKLTSYSFETFGKETDFGKLEDKHLAFCHEVIQNL